MLAVTVKELRSLFLSPLAWSLMAAMQLILAWLFLVQLEQFLQIQPRLAGLENAPGVTSLVVVPLLDSAAVVMMLLVPLLSMGQFSREFSSGTINLLLSSPISMIRIVVGKYLALLSVLAIMLLLVALMPLSLLWSTPLDLGILAAGLLALALTLATYSALGLYLSSLTRLPAVAAISSYGLLLLLWIINLADSGGDTSLFQHVALSGHFHRMLTGLVSSADIFYFLLLILTCLTLTTRRLDRIYTQG